MAKGKPSGLARRIAIALLVLVIAVVAANAVLARFWPVRALIFRVDETLLFEPIPGGRRLLQMDEVVGGERILVEIGRDGFRGAPLAKAPASRIAVYGDSLVMAENVELGDTFVARLGVHLSTAEVPVEAVNAGVTGYGPDQALLKLEREVAGLAPDLVLIVLCASNDFGDLLRNKLFRLDAEGRLDRHRPDLSDRMRDFFAEAERAARRPALLRVVDDFREKRRRTAARDALTLEPPYIRWYLDATRGEYADFIGSGDPRVYNLFQDTYDADLAIYPEWESAQYKRRLMQRVLARLREACAMHDVPLAAIVVPSAVDLCADFEIRVDESVWPTYSPSRLTDALSAILEAERIPHLDLFTPFRDAGPDGLFVGHDDIHWNAAGQELAARLASEFARNSGLWKR